MLKKNHLVSNPTSCGNAALCFFFTWCSIKTAISIFFMRLNQMDYIIIIKNLKDGFYKILDKNSGMQMYATNNAAHAYNKVFPNKELPDFIKDIFIWNNIHDITFYICEFLKRNKKTPPVSIIDVFFLNASRKENQNDNRTSASANDIVDSYLNAKFELEDIDNRFFELLPHSSPYRLKVKKESFSFKYFFNGN